MSEHRPAAPQHHRPGAVRPGPARPPAAGFVENITKEELNNLPLGRYDGPVHLVRTTQEAEQAVAELSRERVLGFDTETRAAFRAGESYPPALVQLAGERAVYLFQLRGLQALGGIGPLLANHSIVKAGVSLGYDLKKLRELHEFHPSGFVELEKLTDNFGIAANGLRGMAGIVMGIRISKSAKCSNWSVPRLSREQVCYAATDAWVCREIYVRLAAKGCPRHCAAPEYGPRRLQSPGGGL